ncbi:hypothetical protein NDU88_002557 [Pleurodeles waltl]|uniref:Uncharacterized protein n=1 Tax=Pleurodeles waltl TaxID=8319 RepID=A0AAV7W4D3_PLEWA|nr:hypothetical protein NDU88_002557 [Pleurodeles waltl]
MPPRLTGPSEAPVPPYESPGGRWRKAPPRGPGHRPSRSAARACFGAGRSSFQEQRRALLSLGQAAPSQKQHQSTRGGALGRHPIRPVVSFRGQGVGAQAGTS